MKCHLPSVPSKDVVLSLYSSLFFLYILVVLTTFPPSSVAIDSIPFPGDLSTVNYLNYIDANFTTAVRKLVGPTTLQEDPTDIYVGKLYALVHEAFFRKPSSAALELLASDLVAKQLTDASVIDALVRFFDQIEILPFATDKFFQLMSVHGTPVVAYVSYSGRSLIYFQARDSFPNNSIRSYKVPLYRNSTSSALDAPQCFFFPSLKPLISDALNKFLTDTEDNFVRSSIVALMASPIDTNKPLTPFSAQTLATSSFTISLDPVPKSVPEPTSFFFFTTGASQAYDLSESHRPEYLTIQIGNSQLRGLLYYFTGPRLFSFREPAEYVLKALLEFGRASEVLEQLSKLLNSKYIPNPHPYFKTFFEKIWVYVYENQIDNKVEVNISRKAGLHDQTLVVALCIGNFNISKEFPFPKNGVTDSEDFDDIYYFVGERYYHKVVQYMKENPSIDEDQRKLSTALMKNATWYTSLSNPDTKFHPNFYNSTNNRSAILALNLPGPTDLVFLYDPKKPGRNQTANPKALEIIICRMTDAVLGQKRFKALEALWEAEKKTGNTIAFNMDMSDYMCIQKNSRPGCFISALRESISNQIADLIKNAVEIEASQLSRRKVFERFYIPTNPSLARSLTNPYIGPAPSLVEITLPCPLPNHPPKVERCS